MITLEVPASQSSQEIRNLSQKLKMLSDPTRLAIMIRLAKGEANVTAIYKALNLSQAAASHHLGLLRVNGFINNRRDGQNNVYSAVGGMIKGKNAVIELPE